VIAPARLAAYDVLRAVNTGRGDLPGALAQVRSRLPDERDRALAGEIATGTLRWQAAFDAIIEAFAKRPVEKLDPEVLDILRLTAFQLLHLDRIPASAAVNDAVGLTGKIGKRSASGLVNAILRRISREKDHLPLPRKPKKVAGTFLGKVPATFSQNVSVSEVKKLPPDQPLQKKVPGTFPEEVPATFSRQDALLYLGRTLSHPRWLVARWLDRYGFDAAERWALFDNAAATLTLRANTLRISRDALAERLASLSVDTEPTRFAPHGLTVRHGNPLSTLLADEGLFFVQDESSQLVVELAGASAGERILDACASPGGKTTAMAAGMGNRGRIVATDLRGRRVDLLARTVQRLGVTCAKVVQADASAVLPFRASFDAVLLDAPCSGLGTLRRDPDIRWRRSEDELKRFAALQGQMLDRVADVVDPGGRIIYATCSGEPEENEEVVAEFLAAHDEFVQAPQCIPTWLAPFVTTDGHFRTLPFRDDLEAFFAAILVKSKHLR
jgi:16S rRNA (cytosine967-C5)-methyltransferase